jgi:hypothetical protein
MRGVTGLVLLVYAASLAQGILIEENQVTRPDSPAQDYSIALSGLTARQERDLAHVPGVRAHALTMDSWTDPNHQGSAVQTQVTALVATCAQLTQFVRHAEGCVDGRVIRLVDPNQSADPGVRPGASFPYRFRQDGHRKTLTVVLPADRIIYSAYDPSAVGGAAVLVPPSALPSGPAPSRRSTS